MGLASRMGALGPPGAAPSAPPAPSASAPGAYPPQQPAYGQPPQPAYGQPPQPAYGQPQATGGPSVPPGYTPPGQDPRYSQGYKPPGQQPGYGQPPPGQYGAPPGQPPPGQYGAPPGQYGAPPGQAPPGQYGAPPGQYGAPPGQPPPGQYGAPPGQYGAPPGQAPYGAPPGQAPYGAPPGQQPYGAPGAQPPYGAPPGQQAYPGNPPQQPAYGQPPQQPGYGQQPGLVTGGGGKYANVIRSRLQKTVQANGLAAFYPQQRLEAVVQRAAQVDFDGLTQRWQLGNVELALDLASLALYDIVLLCDDSGSMQQDDRIEDLTLIVSKISEVATLFDDDGIMVRFLNSNKEGNGIRTEPETKALLGGIPYSGTTPIGPMLQSRVLNTMVYSQPQLAKPVAVYVITDGEPDNRDEVIQTLRQCKDRMSRTAFGAKAVGFQFAQVGNDRGAMRFLESLDNDPLVGDVVDVTSHFEAEQVQCQAKGINLTPHLWLLKMLLGGVDPTYDEQD